MTIPPMLTPSFWFTVMPPPFLLLVDRILLGVSLLMLISGVVTAYWRGHQTTLDKLVQQAWYSAQASLLYGGILGLLLYGFAYERVPYLSMRIWWLALLVWIGWRGWILYQLIYIDFPAARRESTQREQFTKWLPKRKTR